MQDAFKRVAPYDYEAQYKKAIHSHKFYKYLFYGLGYMNALKEKLQGRGVNEDSVADLITEHLYDRTSNSHKWALQLAVSTFFEEGKPQQNMITVNNVITAGTVGRIDQSSPMDSRLLVENELATLLPNQPVLTDGALNQSEESLVDIS
jgi:hypothetical protein